MKPLRRGPAPWLVALLVLLILCCCGATTLAFFVTRATRGTFLSIGGQMNATQQVVRSVDTLGPVLLSVDAQVGNVTVRPTGGAKVTVTGTKKAWGSSQAEAQAILDRIDFRVQQQGNAVQVMATGIDTVENIVRSPRMDLEILVPVETAVSITLKVGDVAVFGTRGNTSVAVDVGDVVLEDVVPADDLRVQARVADIEMRGALAPGAEYRLTSDVGKVTAELPAASSFRLIARSDVGHVTLSGFVVSGSNQRRGLVGATVDGDVGTAPAAALDLRTRVGDVAIRAVP